jgi:hypothetical protein
MYLWSMRNILRRLTDLFQTRRFRYRRELAQLLKKNAEELEPFSIAYDKAVKENKPEIEIRQLLDAYGLQRKKNRDRVAVLETEYLIITARRNLLLVPEVTSNDWRGKVEPGSVWRFSEEHKDLMLNDEGRRQLRRAIRADRRERLELWRLWITAVIPGLTGLIGVLIGLLAVILGRR